MALLKNKYPEGVAAMLTDMRIGDNVA